MSRNARILFALLTVTVDALMAGLALYMAYQLRARIPFPTPLKLGPFSDYLALGAMQIASLLATLFIFRLYHLRRGRSRIDLLYGILSAVSIASLASTALAYLVYYRERDLTRGLLLYSWVLTIPLISLGRALTSRVQRTVRNRHPDRLLLIGTGDVAHMILQKTLQTPQLGFKVVGFADGQASSGDIAGVPILGPTSELPRILRDHDIRQVVIALPQASHAELLDLISVCEDARAEVRIFPDLFQIVASELSIDDLGGLPLLTVRDVALRGWKLTAKRAMDIVVSSIVLIVVSPLMLLIALLIKLESKGPVFYTQVRVGLDGKPFAMIKFRSMRTDAEKETGPVWATADDPRKTRLGAFLRKTSLDEFPQFINVLLGDMSLVGPRPERPVFVEQFRQVVPRYMERHREKAGITGWAQVNGLRGDTSIVERTKYDLYYIENWSLLFDLKIILRTAVNFFRRGGNAY